MEEDSIVFYEGLVVFAGSVLLKVVLCGDVLL